MSNEEIFAAIGKLLDKITYWYFSLPWWAFALLTAMIFTIIMIAIRFSRASRGLPHE